MSASDFESFLQEATEGQSVTVPVLAEGTYKGIFQGFGRKKDGKVTYLQYGIVQPSPTKEKKHVGEAWNMLAARFEIDSNYARTTMGQDNNPFITTDSNCVSLANLRLCDFGLANDNVNFWNFVNGLFEKIGLATKETDESGTIKWVRDKSITQAIYEGTGTLKSELEAEVDLNPKLIPCKLAEKQLENITELLTSEDASREVYLDISRNYDAFLGRNTHVVKRIIIEAAEDTFVFD